MSDSDKRLELLRKILNGCSVDPSCNNSSIDSGLEILDDGCPWLRIVISVVYFVVATAGVLGNLLVMFLLYSTRTLTTGTINFFVFNLALAHLLFSLALPFWAVDIALDYSWPFGLATCKAVSLLTGLNVFASCFFLTAMSLTRYCYVATALKPSASPCSRSCTFPVATAFIWAGALVAATPRAVFADLKHVGNDTACLLRFPDGTAWLGINQLLRVVVGFLLPYATITLSYLLLLRFLCRHKLKGGISRRKADISKSVAVVVLSFCICWFPYNILTLWSVLIQLDIVDISTSFFLAQTYFFPLANCLAFTSSCFNPVIYCLVRKEYRVALHNVLFKLSLAIMSKIPYGINSEEGSGQAGNVVIPLNNMYSKTNQTDTRGYVPLSTLPTVEATL
ncbi:relaxin-3 receptor 1-like [Micropterus salmoides]|uniref:relaxin-3 receptor 1-like n=1 Tax=Micropterus salmoides TaxID=27706 RepID=UPI0018EB144C|nr:relaxin-3 receptor 1-like [Micropterus salmoides]XP_038581065.1 relaxin-3 receptor 1-like [Micropterus salmoides]XP_038581066.1 relaxin-3 receptor 1-like [Micropterus salmoides]XP_038581067.1 relaxin-3 receptor 1-like [Micropterus salmoides]XP_038581068.1 relaxin-3 receptor 1-like [Micropterus salmoides]XP_038581069.1 relaxin-3 receptor 1-like [Micropterus salmoides]